MKDVMIAWGLPGCIGLAGCYLVTSGILGTFGPLFPFIRKELKVERRSQRLLLGFFGLLLAFPVVGQAYAGFFLGVTSVLSAPETPNYVADPPRQTSSVGQVTPTLQQAAYWNQACEVREAFGLAEHQSRQLQYARFRGRVWVRLESVSSLGGSDVYIDIDKTRSTFKVNKKGDYYEFGYEGRRYRLTVTGIYSALVGPSKLAVEVCEW